MGTRGEERLKAITDAATEVVAERGYYGMTIQEVSDRVGITQAGLLKYVKNKNGLLMLVLRRYEDSSEAGDYIQSKLALTPEQRELSPLLMPEYYRTIAEDGEVQARRVDDQAESDQGQYAAADEHQPRAAGRLGLGGHSNLHVRCCFLLRAPGRFHH